MSFGLKLKYCEKAKLWYMDTYSFIVYIKTDDIYKDITEDFETRFGIQIDHYLKENIKN